VSYLNRVSFLIIVIIGLSGQSCESPSRFNYAIDSASPDGAYLLKIKSRAEPPKGTSKYTEHVEIRFFKGEEVIYSYVWENFDQYEPSFRDTAPIIEWVDNNVLRMGEDRSDEPFFDELIISNNTDEYLKNVGVSYSRYESFDAFDLAPRSQIMLRASPGFKPSSGAPNWSLGYSGMTQGGRNFVGTMEGKKRTSPSDGPLKFLIAINPKDLK
jgi:hypothetical protein